MEIHFRWAKSIENAAAGNKLASLIHPPQSRFRIRAGFGVATAVIFLFLAVPILHSQVTNRVANLRRVLMIFGDVRDLPGNVITERAVRAEIQSHFTNSIEFFAESVDASRFPDARHYHLFGDYIKDKYNGQHLDAVMLFVSRDFDLARGLPSALAANLPVICVVVNDLDHPGSPDGRAFTGIFQRFDVAGTIRFIFHLQPETRRVVVVGGISPADQAALRRTAEVAQSVEGVRFEYWTNRPAENVYRDVKLLPEDTVILFVSMQRDAAGVAFYSSHVAQRLTESASVPVYVLAEGYIGNGAVGGNVIDLNGLGSSAGRLAVRVLNGTAVGAVPIEERANGVPMVDWRALQRWHIKTARLPANCTVRYQPATLWETYRRLVLIVATILVAQAMTISALLVQLNLRRRAEAEILRQRTALTHVARVSMLGQLASALTHELNQPLGAILRNAEAAQILLQTTPPNFGEIRAILSDICRDEKRAGDVIDRMRSLFKRQKLSPGTLDLRALVEDTVAMTRPDAEARHVKLKVDMPPELPAAQGDRVHVQQVLLNLIFNGMDAMADVPRSRRLLTVRAAMTANGNLEVSVTDAGIGVSPDNAARIFEPFFTTKASGMGMGLAISRSIIEAHGGDIWMLSSMTAGSSFVFILPPAGSQKIKPGDAPAAPQVKPDQP
jgi:signal transduction histidine kinase